MRIDYPKDFISEPASIADLLRPASNERALQSLALQHSGDYACSDIGHEFRKIAVYLGFWPMFYAEAMILNKLNEPLDDRLEDFVKGMVLGIESSMRIHKHIIFTEAALLWEFLTNAGFVRNVSTQDMLAGIVEEFRGRPQFHRVLTDLFGLHDINAVEDHHKAIPAWNRLLVSHPAIAESLLKPLKPDLFRNAMGILSPEVWKPYSKTSVRLDMQISRDLGL